MNDAALPTLDHATRSLVMTGSSTALVGLQGTCAMRLAHATKDDAQTSQRSTCGQQVCDERRIDLTWLGSETVAAALLLSQAACSERRTSPPRCERRRLLKATCSLLTQRCQLAIASSRSPTTRQRESSVRRVSSTSRWMRFIANSVVHELRIVDRTHCAASRPTARAAQTKDYAIGGFTLMLKGQVRPQCQCRARAHFTSNRSFECRRTCKLVSFARRVRLFKLETTTWWQRQVAQEERRL